ncbi:hypothetical protein JW935_09290 [candidate division KSB1 bacterium]|nr:hypothetical protein [candidate division KSB1 bacterium]
MSYRPLKILIFLGLTLFLLVLTHRPAVIENVLTGAVEQDFIVHISLWRILFEPVVGPVLFFMRADQPLLHYFVLLVWTLVTTLTIQVIRGLIGKSLVKRIKTWAKQLPFLLSVFIALLVFMIFVPLPANTIKTMNNDWILVNIHSHSFFSHDGIISPKALSRWNRYHEFDAFFLTEHNHHKNTLELINANKDSLPSIPLVMCGQEYSGSNHILLLGLTRAFTTKDMPDSVAIDSAHAQNGVAVVAHWFADRRKPVQHYIDCGADGFEIINQAEKRDYDRELFENIKDACIKNDLLLLGSTDYHGYGNVCMTWTAMKIPYWHLLNKESKQDSIMDILRHHRQDRIKVLEYRDRPQGINLIFGPIIQLFYYVHSLGFFQIISWMVWLGLLFMLSRHKKTKVLGLSVIVTGLNGIWMMIWGTVLLIYSIGLDKNKVLLEYGLWLLVVGSLFFLLSFLLLKRQKKLFF